MNTFSSFLILPARISQFLFIVLFSFLLLACVDESTDNGEIFQSDKGNSITLQLVDNNSQKVVRSVKTLSKVTIKATIKTALPKDSENVIVSFSSSIGQIMPEAATGLTVSNGVATVVLDTGELTGAGFMSATAQVGDDSLSVSYNFSVTEGQTTGTTATTDVDDATVDTTDNTSVTDDIDDIPDNVIIGSINFVSTAPDNIVLRGTGGTNRSEISKVTFQLLDEFGEPIVNREIRFSLNTDLGGLSLSPASAFTNGQGEAYTIVYAGTVPTVIRVTAVADVAASDGETYTVFTQSDRLIVSTGIPDQNSFTVAIDNFNPEAANYLGTTVSVTARLADIYNNYVPDGTTVFFTTEGGAIEPYCFTVSGGCSVEWVSADPVPSDHRVTILATAVGNESFVDIDSDGSYSDADGEPFIDTRLNSVHLWPRVDVHHNFIYDEPFSDSNGNLIFDEPFTDTIPLLLPDGRYNLGEEFDDHNRNGIYDGDGDNPAGETTFTDSANGNGKYDGSGYLPAGEVYTDINGNGVFDGPGFVDLGEAYLDANENLQYDIGEPFFDANGDSLFTSLGDEKYNGILCKDGSNCSTETTVHVRASVTLVMSGSRALINLSNDAQDVLFISNNISLLPGIDVDAAGTIEFLLQVTDSAGQVMPSGTLINLKYKSTIKLEPFETFTVPETISSGTNFKFVLTASGAAKDDVLVIEVVTPKGHETIVQKAIRI